VRGHALSEQALENPPRGKIREFPAGGEIPHPPIPTFVGTGPALSRRERDWVERFRIVEKGAPAAGLEPHPLEWNHSSGKIKR